MFLQLLWRREFLNVLALVFHCRLSHLQFWDLDLFIHFRLLHLICHQSTICDCNRVICKDFCINPFPCLIYSPHYFCYLLLSPGVTREWCAYPRGCSEASQGHNEKPCSKIDFILIFLRLRVFYGLHHILKQLYIYIYICMSMYVLGASQATQW